MAQAASTQLAASAVLPRGEEGRLGSRLVSLASAAGGRGGRLQKEWHMLKLLKDLTADALLWRGSEVLKNNQKIGYSSN